MNVACAAVGAASPAAARVPLSRGPHRTACLHLQAAAGAAWRGGARCECAREHVRLIADARAEPVSIVTDGALQVLLLYRAAAISGCCYI